jgi:aminoglycoside phosphotransferase (APT) family kinase protein
LIAAGNEAELFAWEPGTVLKLSRRPGDPAQAQREAAILTALAPLGLAPRLEEIVEVKGRWGIVMERIDRPVLASALAEPGQVPDVLAVMVELHRRLHAVAAPAALPELKQRLASRIEQAGRLDAALRRRLLAGLDDMPDGDRLCHGDFHPLNILGLDRTARVIDWLDAARGDPAADLCRTQVLVMAHDAGLADAYVAAYLREAGLDRRAVEAWRPYVAAARLAENVPAEFDRLAELARGPLLG